MNDELINNENDNELVDNARKTLDEKQARLHEIDILLEDYEGVDYVEDLGEDEYNKYLELKEEYKVLKKELKNASVNETGKKTAWDYIPVWLWIYAIASLILMMYPINPLLYIYITDGIVAAIPEYSAFYSLTFFYILFFSIPFIFLTVTIVTFFKIRKKAKYTKIYLCYMILEIVFIIIGAVIFLVANV